MELRLCTVCGERKEEGEFSPSQRNRNKYLNTGWCKKCGNDKRRENDKQARELLRNSKNVDYKCTMCGETKDVSGFNRISLTSKTGRCQKCAIKRNRKYRDKNREKVRTAAFKSAKLYREKTKEDRKEKSKIWYKSNKHKRKAHSIASIALKNGILKKEPCKVCLLSKEVENWENIQMHHIDYDKPLAVWFLCRSCHMKVHARLKEKGIKL